MSKTLRTAAVVVGAVALGVATYGAAIGPIAAGAAGSAGIGALSVASVGAIAAATPSNVALSAPLRRRG